ncbi:MAG TPA: DUF1844 domain-containing protein [Verrucomicrobiae bacterium]|jgi:hypothetical protein
MSDTTNPTETASQDKMMSALFASMIMQNTNMALIFLGQAPNPQTGETAVELEHAKYFIDLLEMLAFKTKGNLDKQEDALLKQSLTHVRLSFVEAVKNPPKVEAPASAPAASDAPASPPVDEQETPVAEPELPGEKAEDLESRKKFSKKY